MKQRNIEEMIRLEGKNALITGSSRGVGKQIALGLAKLDCNVIVHGRNADSCDDTLEQLRAYPVKTYCVYGDLSDENQVKKLVKQVRDLNINIDILYNNAATMSPYRENFWGHSWEDWASSFRVNVMAMYSLCVAFMPGMIKRGFGRVINLTSGIMDQPELAPYGASKWAVNKLTDDLAVKLKGSGVRINRLDPGWLRTDMGGEYADNPVEGCMPGALAPALVEDNGPNGEFFSALNHNLNL